jgi:hypothetical protein
VVVASGAVEGERLDDSAVVLVDLQQAQFERLVAHGTKQGGGRLSCAWLVMLQGVAAVLLAAEVGIALCGGRGRTSPVRFPATSIWDAS